MANWCSLWLNTVSLNKTSTNAHSNILKSTWLMHKLWIPLITELGSAREFNSYFTGRSLPCFRNGRINLSLPVLHHEAFVPENGTNYCRCEGMRHRGHNFHRIEHPVLQTINKMLLLQMEKCILWNKQLTTIAELNTQI